MEITFPVVKMWGIYIKQHPKLPRELKHPELALSFPLFKQGKNGIIIAWFVFPSVIEGKKAHLGRPLAIIESVWEQNKLSEPTVRMNPKEFFEPNKEFPVQLVYEYSVSPTPKDKIYQIYETLLPLFPGQPSGPLGKELSSLLDEFVYPGLMPYYSATSPKFMDWLRAQ